jgi:8-oxo-dGTP pyrophosphatase MutT (NUDIX family)
MGQINWKDKCWVTTIYLVNKEHNVLLTLNKALNIWTPVGGHMDVGENPEESMKREVAEELGVEFEFYNPHEKEKVGNANFIRAVHVQRHPVSHHKEHMAFVFFGKCTNWNEKQATDEDEKLKWFSEKEILDENGMEESIKYEALMALKKVKF